MRPPPVMRIGVDARELQGHPTGTGRYLRNLLRAWPAPDEIVLYFNGLPPEDPVPSPARLTRRSVGPGGGRGLTWQEWRLPAAARVDRLDVFFAPSYFCPLRLARPRVTAVHDLSFFSHPQDFSVLEGARRRWLVARSLVASTRLITISEFTAREIALHFPAVASRVSIIHCAADADLPAPPTRDDARRGLGVTGPLLLSVGSILNRRCFPALLRALRSVVQAHPTLVLDVVGDNRTHPRLDLSRLAREAGVAPHVRLSGFVSDRELAVRYAAADVAVYLSEYEGFGLPALEAMSRGVPVLTTSRPATGEICAGAAVLVEPDDPVAIAQGLERILSEPVLRADLARRGPERAATFSWVRAAEQTRALLAAAART